MLKMDIYMIQCKTILLSKVAYNDNFYQDIIFTIPDNQKFKIINPPGHHYHENNIVHFECFSFANYATLYAKRKFIFSRNLLLEITAIAYSNKKLFGEARIMNKTETDAIMEIAF